MPQLLNGVDFGDGKKLAFNSLFEMLRAGVERRYGALSLASFNSLFEMLALLFGARAAGLVGAFNSLFEMRGGLMNRNASAAARLSILYLRCATTCHAGGSRWT